MGKVNVLRVYTKRLSTAQLTTYLLKRGYNRNFVNKQIRRAADMPCQLTLQTKDINKPKRIPFITTFNPSLPHISHIIKKHFNLLLSSHRCKSVFQHPPVVAFRRSPNLRDLLVTAKLPFNSTHPQPPSGSFRCGKNCATCPYICHGLTTYTFFSTGETRPIKSNLTCETKNLIYMIQCNRCNLQYIGETKRRLKDRFNEHRRTIDNPNNKSKPTTAAEHFQSSPNHTANDMLLIPIEKIFSNRDSIRKAREAYLIQKGKTIDPAGLNIREETYIYCYLYHVISLFFHLILISSLPCQSFLRISGITKISNKKITFQCKIFIVPEEGWFGQPKYSTHIKTFLRCTGFCLYFLRVYTPIQSIAYKELSFQIGL